VGNPDAAMLSLAESIADGQPIDWAEVEARAGAQDESIVRQLRVISELAGLHRSLSTLSMPPPDAARSRQVSAAPAIGSWGHLTLIERLGGGSSGDVYRAWDRHLERDVALKLLRINDSVADLDTSRITHEARLLARIHHPNVITVYGVASHDNRVGLWMELVRGITLAQQIRTTGPLSAQEAAVVGIDLCRALAAVHAAGLIHRDVKAQNVMREDGGRIVLMDLGTGRETGALSAGAAPDLAGTPLYLAPELFTGAPASERTDLYSLGILLYHVVTGSFPIRATMIQELHEAHTAGRIVRLRDARADLPTAFVGVVERAIATDPQRRYATAGECEAELAEALSRLTVAGAIRPASGFAPGLEEEKSTSRRIPRFAALAATLAVLVTAGAGGWVLMRQLLVSPVVPAGTIRSIAVLPLVNLSGDPAQDYFADGMTDELIGTLGQLGGLNVISRTSIVQFRGSKKPLPEIAKALNVDAVFEGAVLVLSGARPGDPNDTKRVRITARLIYAGTDTQLWDRTFERVGADVLALQSEVARAVADGINLRLTSQQQRALAKAPGDSGGIQQFDAFDLYLKGRYYWNMRTQEGLTRSMQYFQESIARGYTPAYAGLADAYHLLGVYNFMPHADARSRARAAASKALEIDDTIAEAYASLGYIHGEQLEWSAAEASLRHALELKPGYATAHHWYALILVQRGRFAEAASEVNKALALDPLSNAVNGQLGAILVFERQYDKAIAHLEKAVQIDPAYARNHLILAEAYALRGTYDRALAEAEKAAVLSDDAGARADLGFVHAMAGRRQEALAVVRNLMDRYDRHEDGSAGGLAIVYAGLGDLDQAFVWLDRSRTLLDPVIGDLKVDPRFDKLRGDPRFAKLLATVGLAQ
jgi:eukaryotic-like serine/threonine-protein kinase